MGGECSRVGSRRHSTPPSLFPQRSNAAKIFLGYQTRSQERVSWEAGSRGEKIQKSRWVGTRGQQNMCLGEAEVHRF